MQRTVFCRRRKPDVYTLRRLIIVHMGANNDYTGGPDGPGTGFCGPGGGFLVLAAVVACHHFYYH